MKIKPTTVLLSLLLLLAACKDSDNSPTDLKELTVDQTELVIRHGSSKSVNIISGNGTYTVISSNENVVKAEVKDRVITITAPTRENEAEALLVVSDQYERRANIHISVKTGTELKLDKHDIRLAAMQAGDTLNILSGNGKYRTEVANPAIIRATVENNRVTITGKRNGTTTFTVKDDKGEISEPVTVTVDGPLYAMNLGTAYFCYANFKEIGVYDNFIRNCKQVTFEIYCKIDGYRGLQTFMGLEGKLIMRGKYDDYKETHPIEIAGLGDKVMLESTGSFNLNEWMHLALVVDCSQETTAGKYKLYINGVQDELKINKEEQTHTSVDLASSSDGDRFEIGRACGQDFRAMRGIAAEARVWTTARTSTEIQENMHDLKDAQPEGLLARWIFSAGVETNYIQDINGGKYETNLIIAPVAGGGYSPVIVPKDVFVERPNP